MIVASVDFRACAGAACPKCPAVKACDVRAILRIDEDEPAVVDRSLCHGCGDCVTACPYGALAVITV